MRSSRYIRCGSGVRLRRNQTRPPLLSRSTATYSPSPSDHNPSSHSLYCLPQPNSQPNTFHQSAQAPSSHAQSQNYATERSDPEYLQELHRKVWGDRSLPPAEDPTPGSEQGAGFPSNETSGKATSVTALRPSHELDGRSDAVWKKGLTELRVGRLSSYSVSAHTAAILQCQTAEEARRVWAEQDSETIQYGWVSTLLTLLSQDVRRACLFLQALCPLSDPPVVAMTDSIRHICSSIWRASEPDRSSGAEFLCDAVIHILREHPDRGELLRQRDVYRLQKLLPPGRLAELYDEMCRAGVYLHHYTLMQIATSLAKEPSLKRRALDILVVGLSRLKNEPEGERLDEMRRGRWASVFTTILHTSYAKVPRNSSVPTRSDVPAPDEIWEVALENGLEPNEIQITALVDSLFAVGRGDAAWQVFDMFMEERKMPVPLKLASTLLHGSRMTGNLPHMQRALAILAETGEMDAVLGNDILHLVLRFALADSTKVFSSFRLMQRLYSRMFKSEALDALIPEKLRGVVDPDTSLEDMMLFPGFASHLEKLFAAQKGMLMEPTVATLEVMVLSWICSLKQGFKGPALIAFYGHYRGMLKQRHPVAVGIVEAKNSIIHDMIIKGMGTSSTHLRSALEVIGDMLRDHEEPTQPSGRVRGSASGEEARKAEPVHPRPTTWTWNILLGAWLQHFKQESVGRIISLMKKHGVEPTIVTWNTILSRAAARNNTHLAVEAARGIRDGGFEADEWTVNAFSRLRSKETFFYEMQQRAKRSGTGPARKGGRPKIADDRGG